MFLIVFSVLFLLNPSLKFAANTRTTITGGSISGFITGIVGTGGTLRAMFLTGFNLEKTKYVATAAVIALATDSTRIISYLYQGFLLPQYYHYMPLFIATAIGGSFIGRKIVGKINQSTFKKNCFSIHNIGEYKVHNRWK